MDWKRTLIRGYGILVVLGVAGGVLNGDLGTVMVGVVFAVPYLAWAGYSGYRNARGDGDADTA